MLVLVALAGVDAACPVSGAKRGTACPHLRPPLKPQGDVTASGCSCTSKCGATVTEGFAKCDWCYTSNGCGQSSLSGSWDYCVYPPMKEFDAQDHITKLAQVWSNTTAAGVVNQSAPVKSAAATLAQILGESMITPFSDQWEVLPDGRTKVIHGQGVVCKFDLNVVATSPFTGILAAGSQAGLIRLGSASSLDLQIFPGYGIKFMRSATRSADWVGLRAAGPGGSFNFFNSSFSNHVSPPSALVALHKFQQASDCIDMVGLSDACSHTQAGDAVPKPVFPFEILFEPTGAVRFADEKKTDAQLLGELAGIPVGTALFNVLAYASPAEKKAGKKTRIGSMSTTSRCVQSLFGDNELFFRHQRMEEDFAAAPEWIAQMKELGDPVCQAVQPSEKTHCPAAK